MPSPFILRDYTHDMLLPRCRSALITMFLSLLPACGQKGPLYLPDSNGTIITRPTQTPDPPAPQPTEPAAPTEPATPPSDARDDAAVSVPTPR